MSEENDVTENEEDFVDEFGEETGTPDTETATETTTVASEEETEEAPAKPEPIVYDVESKALRRVTASFAACGRCSYFWAGYRVIHSVPKMEAAVAGDDREWFILEWNHEMRRLMLESYGCRLDVEHLQYAGRCPECGRAFEYQAETEEHPAFLKVKRQR